jgi:hypothetical protein
MCIPTRVVVSVGCRVQSVTVSGGLVLAGKVLDKRLQKKRLKFNSEPALLWVGLQRDALGIVLRFLPCKADHSRLRSVCHYWRKMASGHVAPPPLPLLVLPRFRFSSLSPRGTLTTARPAWMPLEVVGDHVCCVGSSGDWLVVAREPCGECFLVNVFSHKVVNLPCLSDSGFCCSVYLLHKVVLSASPDSGSDFLVAAFGYRRSKAELSFWRPGMMSWHVCQHVLIGGYVDIAFYQGKLYVLSRFVPWIYSFELKVDKDGIRVTHFEDCLIESRLPKPLRHNDTVSCNLVVWRGKLLLIIRYYGRLNHRRNVLKVEVLALDFSIKLYGVTEIRSFGTDCIFVGSGGNSFPAGLHDF